VHSPDDVISPSTATFKNKDGTDKKLALNDAASDNSSLNSVQINEMINVKINEYRESDNNA